MFQSFGRIADSDREDVPVPDSFDQAMVSTPTIRAGAGFPIAPCHEIVRRCGTGRPTGNQATSANADQP